MVQRIILLGLIGLVLLSACSANKDTGYTDTAPDQLETIGSNIDQPEESASDIPQISPSEMHEPEQSTEAKEIVETESQKETTQALEIYEGEYTGDTINDPDYDGLEIQKNEGGTYAIQVKIPFLTKLYDCTGYQSENAILFSTSEWGADKKLEGSISLDGDSATVTFTSGWYQTATAESSYQYHKTSDTPHLENGPGVHPDYGSFTGKYCDTNNEPSLEIQLNEDGSYLIQISLFREVTTYLFHKTSDNLNIDYETLGIQKQEYPSKFSMGDNLKTAITQLALSYDDFGKDSVSSESWKEIFIARFIQNSRASFDYLDRVSDENNGEISVDQLDYIQFSLTNTEVDFSSEPGDSVNRYDAASSLNYGWISGYSYEETKDGVIVTADLETGYDGTDSTQKRKITVELIKNPYSCFDGYSVITISSETENSDPEQQN